MKIESEIDALYADEYYTEYLESLASKNLLPFDDYRQEVFLELLEHGGAPRPVAKKIAMRMRRRQIREGNTFSIDEEWDAIPDEECVSVLWEDRHTITA